jgi:hypothetical protein
MQKQLWQSLSGTLDATGAVTLTVGPVPLNERWGIQRIATIGAGAANPILTLYRNTVQDGYAIDGTPSTTGNRDFNFEYPWLVIDEGETLLLRYTGGTVGAQVTCNVGYVTEDIRPRRKRTTMHRPVAAYAVDEWSAGGQRPLAGQHPTSAG